MTSSGRHQICRLRWHCTTVFSSLSGGPARVGEALSMFVFPPYENPNDEIEQADQTQSWRMSVSETIHLVTEKETEDGQSDGKDPERSAQESGRQPHLGQTMDQQVGGGKMLCAGGKMTEKGHEMGGDKIGRIFLQFPLRQPADQVVERCRGGKKRTVPARTSMAPSMPLIITPILKRRWIRFPFGCILDDTRAASWRVASKAQSDRRHLDLVPGQQLVRLKRLAALRPHGPPALAFVPVPAQKNAGPLVIGRNRPNKVGAGGSDCRPAFRTAGQQTRTARDGLRSKPNKRRPKWPFNSPRKTTAGCWKCS